jgi:hypothetical protein
VSETESAGRLDGIQPFPGQNGRIPAGRLGSGHSPAVLVGDPVLSRPERLDPSRDSALSRPELPDPSRLARIRPFPGRNCRGSGPFLTRTAESWSTGWDPALPRSERPESGLSSRGRAKTGGRRWEGEGRWREEAERR